MLGCVLLRCAVFLFPPLAALLSPDLGAMLGFETILGEGPEGSSSCSESILGEGPDGSSSCSESILVEGPEGSSLVALASALASYPVGCTPAGVKASTGCAPDEPHLPVSCFERVLLQLSLARRTPR